MVKAAPRPRSERHIPWSSWLMLGLFLITNRWPPAPVTRRACHGLHRVTAVGEVVATAGPARVTATAAAAVTTLSKVLTCRPGIRHLMSFSLPRVRTRLTITASIPADTVLLPHTVRPAVAPDTAGRDSAPECGEHDHRHL